MTAPSTSFNIETAIIRHLRADSAVKTAIGSNFHQGFAPAKTSYPFLVYNLVYAPVTYGWGWAEIIGGIDIFVLSDNSVVANNLDALVNNSLFDASLDVDEQTTLICRRVADLKSSGIDEEGKKYYQIGGTYEIWTYQPLAVLTPGQFAADAVVSSRITTTFSIDAVIV